MDFDSDSDCNCTAVTAYLLFYEKSDVYNFAHKAIGLIAKKNCDEKSCFQNKLNIKLTYKIIYLPLQ